MAAPFNPTFPGANGAAVPSADWDVTTTGDANQVYVQQTGDGGMRIASGDTFSAEAQVWAKADQVDWDDQSLRYRHVDETGSSWMWALLRGVPGTQGDTGYGLEFYIPDSEWLIVDNGTYVASGSLGSLNPVVGIEVIFEVEGTNLRFKAWNVGDAEPGSWTYSGTHTSRSSGRVGWHGWRNSGRLNLRNISVVDLAAPPAGDIEGDLAATEASDTAAISGDVVAPPQFEGDIAATEGADTSAISGGIEAPPQFEGDIAATEGADTSSIAGEVAAPPALTGSISSVEQGDTGDLTGEIVSPPDLEGSLAATEEPDTAALAGEVVSPPDLSGGMAATEADDAAALAGEVVAPPDLSGTIASTEEADTAALAGEVVAPPDLAGTVASTEADDTAVLAGEVVTSADVAGAVAATEGDDTSAIVGEGVSTSWPLAYAVGVVADEYAAASDTVLSSELSEDSQWRTISAVFDGSTSQVRVDDDATETGDTGSVTPTHLHVGGRALDVGLTGEHWVGEIAEVLVYGEELAPEDIDAIHEYLAAKYGL